MIFVFLGSLLLVPLRTHFCINFKKFLNIKPVGIILARVDGDILILEVAISILNMAVDGV
jgi:hypothetical protein